jgi:hypothetical protein
VIRPGNVRHHASRRARCRAAPSSRRFRARGNHRSRARAARPGSPGNGRDCALLGKPGGEPTELLAALAGEIAGEPIVERDAGVQSSALEGIEHHRLRHAEPSSSLAQHLAETGIVGDQAKEHGIRALEPRRSGDQAGQRVLWIVAGDERRAGEGEVGHPACRERQGSRPGRAEALDGGNGGKLAMLGNGGGDLDALAGRRQMTEQRREDFLDVHRRRQGGVAAEPSPGAGEEAHRRFLAEIESEASGIIGQVLAGESVRLPAVMQRAGQCHGRPPSPA